MSDNKEQRKEYVECVMDFTLNYLPTLIEADSSIKNFGVEAVFEILLEEFKSGNLSIFIADKDNFMVVKMKEETDIFTIIFKKEDGKVVQN